MRVPIADIRIHRSVRQRRELTSIKELAFSISTMGLINPIVIDRSNVLIAGERRLEACRLLGHTDIECTYKTDLSRSEQYMMELEENIRRENLAWPDHVQAVKRFHEMRAAETPGWSQMDTSLALNLSQTKINRDLMLAAGLEQDPALAETKKYKQAVNKIRREDSRKKLGALQELEVTLDNSPSPAPKPPPIDIIQADFLEWAHAYEGPPFNFLHCDFPYGVDIHKGTATSIGAFEVYEDSEAYADRLFDELIETRKRFTTPEHHIMFWCSAARVPTGWGGLRPTT